ncbi:hypothetical protein AUC61_07430 [Pseudomonas sp. S25]|uniref:Phage-related protein n=1 Tax=Pseudomonas maioricensis TaxID=1766623 RepID=A0ABS9ZKE7_9PSED|nr:type II toxin-antitoxin system RelE/ParE family toxin [Pseudomonas sp. S25]MCI8209363.1 hypothetical protein [Pseudomonas sp. S25]
MKPLVFLGDTLEQLRGFPLPAQAIAGFQLDRVQRGIAPEDWKPMASIGAGVREIRVREISGAFRVVYLATLPNAVYVLHAFRKTTQKTANKDITLATLRLGDLIRSRA